MSRIRRWTVVAVAWVASITWVVAAMLAGPSDGSVLSTPTEGGWWDTGPTVARTYGDTALRPGDRVLAVDGRPLAEWLSSGAAPGRAVGDVLIYEVRRPAAGLDRILELEVALSGFPLVSASRDDVPALALCLLVLTVGSAAFVQRPRAAAPRALLAASALLPAAMTSTLWGVSPIDLAGGRGVWPQVGGEVLATLGVLAALLAVAALTPPTRRLAPWLRFAALLAPVLGYAAWLTLALGDAGSDTDRRQVLGTVLEPAAVSAVPAILMIAGLGLARATDRTDVLAARLLLLGAGSGLIAWLLLDQVPRWSTGGALLPREVVLLLVAPVVVGSMGAAVGHYRLGEIEPLFRRGVVQASVLVLVAGAFAGLVRAADVAAGVSVSSMLVGGVAALVLLPIGVAVQRALRRTLYGDRELPHRVVSDLRRLDLLSAPEEALQGMLGVLARRLHLGYAAVEVFATPTSDAVATSIGAPYATPATIDLVAGGTTLGRLEVEVDAVHDPFGPGDRRLLEDVGGQVGALVQAVAINRELQRARQRLVEAREEERRRIRRDLHDGLGPSLATLAMRLEVAQELIADDPAGAADLVGDLSEAARNEIAEVRRLVDGLRPPALDQLGLVTALRQRAAEQLGGRAPSRVPWRVQASTDVDPLPAAVEVAAYRIVVEAVNNVQRHSGAEKCVVTLRREPAALMVTIHDTGEGLALDHPVGVGLSSMRERAEELGGTFELESGPGRGTSIRVRLPVGQDLEDGGQE